jgi:hypothetical protein
MKKGRVTAPLFFYASSMFTVQPKLIARLAIGFCLSLLLHALLLLALSAPSRKDNGGRGHDVHGGWNALSVRIDTLQLDSKPATREAESIEPDAKPLERPAVPAASSARAGSALPGLPGTLPDQPSAPQMQYQSQMSYQQMQAVRAEQMAREQRQFVISHLQADIEQRLNQRDAYAAGRCSWKENKTGTLSLRCEPKSLEQLFLPERESLVALRDTLRMQGLLMEGFVVRSKEGRSVVDYLVHAVAKD